MPTCRAVVSNATSHTNTPSASCSNWRVRRQRLPPPAIDPRVRPATTPIASAPYDPTAAGCGAVMNRGHDASSGTSRRPSSHGTPHTGSLRPRRVLRLLDRVPLNEEPAPVPRSSPPCRR